jgi:hypothetical protein
MVPTSAATVPTSAAAKACPAALGLHGGNVAGLHIAEATFPRWSCRATSRPITATTNIRAITATTNIRAITATAKIRLIAATANIRAITATANIRAITATTNIRAITATANIRAAAEVRAVAAGARLQDLIAAATAEIEPCLAPIPDRIVAEPLLHICIVISHAAAMIGVMLPFIDVDIVGPIDVDVVVAPIATAAPIIAPIGPASDGIANPKRHTSGDRRTGNISGRWREVVRWISRIGPRAINHGRVIVRHVDRVGICRRDSDNLFAVLLLG